VSAPAELAAAVSDAHWCMSRGWPPSPETVRTLLAAIQDLTTERDTAVQRLDAGVRDLARARGVHPDVIRVAMGLHNPTGLCDTEPPLHVVGGRPA